MQEAKYHLEIDLSVKCFDFGEILEVAETFESSALITKLYASGCVWSVWECPLMVALPFGHQVLCYRLTSAALSGTAGAVYSSLVK